MQLRTTKKLVVLDVPHALFSFLSTFQHMVPHHTALNSLHIIIPPSPPPHPLPLPIIPDFI